MQQSPWTIAKRMAAVGGAGLMLAGVVWGGLVSTLALADSTQFRFNPPHQPAAQIGVLACPSNPTITFNPTNPQAGEEVEFNAGITVPGGVITFTWNFGDGSAEENGQEKVPHIYRFDGVCTVIMTATGDGCATPAVATRNITVGTGIPPASIIYLPLLFKSYPPLVFPTGSSLPAPALAVPRQVTGLAGFVDEGAVYLSWHANPPADAVRHYQVYRRKQGLAEVEVFELWRIVPANRTTFTDPAAACGTVYYITAANAAGESAASAASYFSPACSYSNASGMAAP